MFRKTSFAPGSYSSGERKFDLGTYIQDYWMPAILQAINESNLNKYHTLIEELDITLDPFHDHLYRQTLHVLKAERKRQLEDAKNQAEATSVDVRYYRAWRRALMNLMARENLMRQEDGVLDET